MKKPAHKERPGSLYGGPEQTNLFDLVINTPPTLHQKPGSQPISKAAQDIISPEWEAMQEFIRTTDKKLTAGDKADLVRLAQHTAEMNALPDYLTIAYENSILTAES